MSNIFGTRGIGDWSSPDERPTSYHELIFKKIPNFDTLFNLLSKVPSVTFTDFEYSIFEEDIPAQAVTVDGIHTSTTTTIALKGSDAAKVLTYGTMLHCVRTDEIFRVASDPVSPFSSVAVDTRGSWAPADDKAALADNDILEIMPNAGEEGGEARTPISDTLTVVKNYLQDSDEPFEITDWAENMEIRPKQEKAYAREKRRALERFKSKVSRALYWGKKKKTTVGGKTVYTTGGIKSFIPAANIFDDTTTGTSAKRILEIFLALRSYGQGSEVKWALAGSGAITRLAYIVSQITNGNFNMSSPMDQRGTWGITVRELQGPTLRLQVMEEGALSMYYPNRVMIIDPKYLKKATLAGPVGALKVYDDIKKDNNPRVKKGEVRGIMGVLLGQPYLHGMWDVGEYVP